VKNSVTTAVWQTVHYERKKDLFYATDDNVEWWSYHKWMIHNDGKNGTKTENSLEKLSRTKEIERYQFVQDLYSSSGKCCILVFIPHFNEGRLCPIEDGQN
jgi:hypothetical protein